ncbi:MAG: sigma-54 dependent transcriptional regulator [Deltaproteobacteria bacterium]|jgi:two-component system response regulator AtoC
MIQYSVYIVDDEETIREGVTMALEADYQVTVFDTGEAAIHAMGENPPDLVLLDIGLPGMDGIEALRKIRDFYPEMLVIMITAYEDVGTVVAAMKLGAYDYVVKPLHMDALEVTVQNALETIRLRKEVQDLQERYLKENLPCIIGESSAIQDVMEFISAVAKSPDTPVLLIGETGTGKELIAQAVHYRSPNFKGPFMTVNCAAIPKDLTESELFGYEKGAFSGARASGKKGLIEEAANGTLFLDEIGDLSLEAQAKLLRFLESGEYYRVGGTKTLHLQTRVVSATNKDLDTLIEVNLFRKDLYFRLGIIKVHIPSLNERREDIVPLAKHFLVTFSNKFGKTFTNISQEAESVLMAYNFTGHVRELRNLIERAALTGKGPELSSQDLGIEKPKKTSTRNPGGDEFFFPPLSEKGVDLVSAQESLERHYIEEALGMAKGNESKAAKLLNMNHHTFRYRRKKLQIP